MKQKIALLGLGAMGARMAQRLLDAGYALTVYNRTAARAAPLVERGARHAASPRDAATDADVVISMVRDDDASRAVWFSENTGAALAMGKQAVAIESSTLTPEFVSGWHRALTERGIACLDAPVAGSRPQAEAGELAYLVGGESDTLGRVREVLSTLGSAIHHAGPASGGTALKLAVNALLAVQAAATGEALGLLARSGLDRAAMAEILASLPITSPALRALLGAMSQRRFSPMFPVELVEKDLGYVEAAAGAVGAEVPVSAAAHSVFSKALALGLGSQNIAAVCRVFEGSEGS